MANAGWFVGTMYAGLVSTAISNLLNTILKMEWMFTMINYSVVIVALALCGEPGGQFL